MRKTSKKENYFIIETFDEEINMRIQFHYWTSGKYCYSSTEFENGMSGRKHRISEKEYVSAFETYINA